ncbi:MAG: yhdG 2 [Acidobacteria bacterium]|nr:yhdG 2 [Acidobacteriota bacterium]
MLTLKRALGRWDLTAIGVNQVIGGAIFLWPAQVAAQVGAWSPIGFVLIGVLSLSVALCFAELGSRFDTTGGPYVFTRAAFGDFVGFEIGWMQWFSRASSQASIMAATAIALGYYWPALTTGWPRAAFLAALTLIFAAINIRGVRHGSAVVNVMTVGKLVPLAIFIVVGFAYVQPSRLTTLPSITLQQSLAAGLLLIFIYGGYEVVPVPAGESLDPRRDVPFAMIATIVSVMIIMTLTQVVAQGVLGDVASHATPIADAAAVFLGAAGALLIGIGSVVSMTGNNAGQVLSGSRMIFALAEQGQLPALLARIHPIYRTPANAIIFTSGVALTLALSGSFAQIALVSALARLLMYGGSAAATLRLRSPRFAHAVKPAGFTAPFGPVMPIAAIGVCAALAAGATGRQLLGGVAALAIGGILFLCSNRASV